MTTPPVVSVVVPVYNGDRFIADTLRAVLRQSQPQTEIIVVDDGSSDGTVEVVRKVAPAAHVLQQRNAGVSAARNRGLAEAHGRYVVFLDQDDIWHPQQLARQVTWLEAHPEDGAAVCRYHHWRPSGGVFPDPATIWGQDPGLATDPDFSGYVYHQFLFDCWALTSGTLLRREALQTAGGFNEGLPFSEDWDLWLRLSLTTRFACLTWPPVLYRHHPVQGSRTVRERDYRVELLERYAAEHGLASADGRAIDPRRFRDAVAGYKAAFGLYHLANGDRWTGVRALSAAWLRQPRALSRLARAIAGGLGWRPGT